MPRSFFVAALLFLSVLLCSASSSEDIFQSKFFKGLRRGQGGIRLEQVVARQDAQFAHVSLMSTTDQTISERYAISDKADSIRNVVPRWGYTSDIATLWDSSRPVGDTKTPSYAGGVPEYAFGLGTTAAWGIVITVLTLIASVCCVFCNLCVCCCKLCGCCKGAKKEYSFKEKWIPFGILAFFCLVVLAFGAVGYTYNSDFSNGLYESRDKSVVGSVQTMIHDAVGVVNDVKAPIIEITSNFRDSSFMNAVKNNNTNERLFANVDNIRTQLNQISTLYDDLTVRQSADGTGYNTNVTYYCVQCFVLGELISNVTSQLDTVTQTALDAQDKFMTNVQQKITDAAPNVISKVDDVLNQMTGGQDKANNISANIDDVLDVVKKYDDIRKKVYVGIFALPMALTAFVLVAGLLKTHGWPFTVVWIFGMFILFIFGLLLAIHLPLAILTGDSCVYLKEAEMDIKTELGADAAKVFEACLLDSSLIEAFNLTDDVDFSKYIPDLGNISIGTDMFRFNQMDLFIGELKAVNLSSFHATLDPSSASYSHADTVAMLNKFNQDYCVTASPPIANCGVSPYFTLATINTADTTSLGTTTLQDQAFNDKWAVWEQWQAEQKMQPDVDDIHTRADKLDAYIAETIANYTNIKGRLDELKALVNPILTIGDTAKRLARCGFVGRGYMNFKEGYCVTFVTSITMMSLSIFIISLSYVAINITAFCIKARFQQGTSDKVETMEAQALPADAPPVSVSPVNGPGSGSSAASGSDGVVALQSSIPMMPMTSGAQQGGQAQPMGPAGPQEPIIAPAVYMMQNPSSSQASALPFPSVPISTAGPVPSPTPLLIPNNPPPSDGVVPLTASGQPPIAPADVNPQMMVTLPGAANPSPAAQSFPPVVFDGPSAAAQPSTSAAPLLPQTMPSGSPAPAIPGADLSPMPQVPIVPIVPIMPQIPQLPTMPVLPQLGSEAAPASSTASTSENTTAAPPSDL